MDRTIICLLFVLCPYWCLSQKKASTSMTNGYIQRHEKDMKKYAARLYYGRQLTLTDTVPCVASNEEGLDPFVTEFFNNAPYQYPALLKTMDFADKMAKEQLRFAVGHHQCYCFESMLDFHNSAKLDSFVKSLRKYLYPPEKD